MRLLIWHKLFIALLAATVVVVTVSLVLTRWSFNRGFLDYINTLEAQRIEALASTLAGIYAETNSWDALIANPGRYVNALRQHSRGIQNRPPGASPPPLIYRFSMQLDRRPGERTGMSRPPPELAARLPKPLPGPLGVRQPIDLLDSNGVVLSGNPANLDELPRIAITLNGNIIGYLRYQHISDLTDLDEAAERQFLAQQRAGLLGTFFIGLLIAAVLAYLLGRKLVAPVQQLVSGTQALAAGQLQQRISVTSNDELGQLANDFNTMAAALEQSRRSQQQWVVDIAHELRTPLAILSGELQAAEDGVREWNTEARVSLQAEVARLAALVEDLRDVSMADAGGLDYQFREVSLNDCIHNAIESRALRINECGLSISCNLPEAPIVLRADPRRLQQVLSNLLENSCRYTDAGGRIQITCSRDSNTAYLTIEDTAPGAPDEALPQLFDRLYRVEASRNRGHGGSGLGLAICKGIVEAHGGRIYAEASPLGGLAIKVELPL
jgi:two-component system sensor histidine kinase BaeS